MQAQIIPIDTKLSARKRRELIDELGQLSLRLEALRKEKQRYDQLRTQISNWHDTDDAAASFVETGDQWTINLSARSYEREITSMAALKKYLGLSRFLGLCKFNLGDIDKHIPVEDRAPFVACEQTGSRTLTPIRKCFEKAA